MADGRGHVAGARVVGGGKSYVATQRCTGSLGLGFRLLPEDAEESAAAQHHNAWDIAGMRHNDPAQQEPNEVNSRKK